MHRHERFGCLGLLWQAVFVGLGASLMMALLALSLAPQVQAATQQGLRLYGGGDQVTYAPQLSTEVSIRISGALTRVTVRQRFNNPSEHWVEGRYTFPLPENAAVDRLRMRYAGRLVEGEIQERQQARRTYEHARASGRGASLLDQQRANIFTTSVANIPPQEVVQVEIEYQQQLRWQAGEFTLRLPLVVAPRYIPGTPLPGPEEGEALSARGWAQDTDQVADASAITPPVALRGADGFNGVSIEVELNSGLQLAEITSPHHRIQVQERAPGSYHVSLADGKVPADRDFVLRWRPRLAEQPTAALFVEQWRGQHYGLLMVMPPQAQSLPTPIPRELVLVVDTSGSMHGDSMAQARQALLKALQQLKPADRFNIIQFNSNVHALFDEAVPAHPRYLRQARSYVRDLQAEGGTEMLPAMQLALKDPRPSGLLRQVVFVTDGAVGNEQALFQAVSREIGDSRLFTVGIGSAPNTLFMRKAAEFGRGTFTYIGSTQEVGRKVAALFRQLSAPVLTDVRLNWQTEPTGVPVAQAPEIVPDLYAGEPLVIAVKAGSAPRSVQIEGRLGGRLWQQRTVLQGGAAGDAVHALWARRKIQDRMAGLVTGEEHDKVRETVLALAMEHRLVSRYTSLVAVDRTPVGPPNRELKSTVLATRLPAGWSGPAVFGRLPGTATPAPTVLLVGLGALLLAWVTRVTRV